jgi:hypothetical protein
MPRTLPVAPSPTSFKASILETLAHQLELFEDQRRPFHADQYRALVARLGAALRDAPAGLDLDALLSSFPATAQLYENLNYAVAGLCRSPLELSLTAELQARQALTRAGRTLP